MFVNANLPRYSKLCSFRTNNTSTTHLTKFKHLYFDIWLRTTHLRKSRVLLQWKCKVQDNPDAENTGGVFNWQPSLTENINPIDHPSLINEMFWEAKKQVEAARRGERMSGEESIERYHQRAAASSVKKKQETPKTIYLLSRSERRIRRLKKRISVFFSGLLAPIVDWHSVLRNRIREIGLVEWGEPKQPTICEKCHSFGFKPCAYCNTLGVRYTQTGRAKAICIHCLGLGWQTCPHCHGHQPESWMQDMYL
ncbi:hypothetical protein Gasu_25150 isoform 2 [Galdieria sulphuraria]|uniref:Uncharacterized protein n=1 Tax=Galdieria sulphuraria TaxID=130081 RepID=M2XJ51_GALSU|nr:hypothetical protein Gasu_25150 isoform 2 [Galdieria sulphuraria]EME30137.1 hypothetical protein isoform 2 [Galdieria sulphuraria]|eukprot:XP_005706657.1 hypothetical protein isoform 2 [Galdieria sulphuraria]